MSSANRRVLFASLAYLLCLLLLQVAGAVFVWLFPAMSQNAMLALVELLTLGLPALLFILLWRGATRPVWIGPWVLLTVPLAIVGVFAFTMLTGLWSALLTSLGGGLPDIRVPLPETPSQLAVSLVVVALVPALCEEGLFRGVLLPALGNQRRGRAKAIILSGLAFGLMHGSLTGLWGHVLLGIMLGVLAVYSGSLLPPMLYHFTHNAVSVIVAYFAADVETLAAAAEAPPVAGAFTLIVQAVLGAGCFVIYAVLVALFVRGVKRRGTPALSLERPQRVAWYAYLPLAIGLALCIALYVVDGLMLFGADPLGGLLTP